MLPLNEREMSYLWRVENLNQSEIQTKFSLAFKTKMSRGRPRKRVITRNTTGLCNQNSVSTYAAGYVSAPSISEPDEEECQSKRARWALSSSTSSPDTSDDEENDWQRGAVFDSLKYVADESNLDDELEEGGNGTAFAGVDEAEFCARLEELAVNAGDDPLDATWLPPKQAKCAAQRKQMSVGRPKKYKKGPDVGSKAERTKRRYKKLLADQKKLTAFGFAFSSQKSGVPQLPQTSNPLPTVLAAPTVADDEAMEPSILSLSPPPSPANELGESPSITNPCNNTQGSLGRGSDDGSILNAGRLVDDAEDAWEDVLEEQERGGVEIRGWDELREQVKDDLAKGAKTSLPLSRVNQLMLIRSFATLRLKGLGCVEASLEIARQWHEGEGKHFARKVRALARHYQVFEQLPTEKRGGRANALSPLKDERLQLAARQWLMLQDISQVTLQRFHHALNETIIPSLGIGLAKPLCERTARRWLLKLGWQQTRLRKGVYMDGHERDDVKKYRQEVFLPAMAAFERRMVHFEGPEMLHIDPQLAPGERKVIAIFHDECCFHGNDYRTHA